MPVARHVLVIDDDNDIREAVAEILLSEGYEVDQAKNGIEGLRAARAEHPSLILLDLMMPVMDGTEFLRLLRRDPELRALPVVLVTAFGATSRAADLAAETQGCLAKPIELDELIETVSRHCPPPRR